MSHRHANPHGLPPKILLPIVCALASGAIALLSLVELHDGTVVAHSAGAGQGSTFVLTLPRLPETPAAGSP